VSEANAGRERMIRAVALGLSAGMLLGGVTMMGLAYRLLTAPDPCDAQPGNDCSIEQAVAYDFATYQAWFGLAMALLGTALLLYVWSLIRRERRAAKEV
jgi:hypothetical protein